MILSAQMVSAGRRWQAPGLLWLPVALPDLLAGGWAQGARGRPLKTSTSKTSWPEAPWLSAPFSGVAQVTEPLSGLDGFCDCGGA